MDIINNQFDGYDYYRSYIIFNIIIQQSKNTTVLNIIVIILALYKESKVIPLSPGHCE